MIVCGDVMTRNYLLCLNNNIIIEIPCTIIGAPYMSITTVVVTLYVAHCVSTLVAGLDQRLMVMDQRAIVGGVR